MTFILQPWQLFFLILVGWFNRQQQEAIEYLPFVMELSTRRVHLAACTPSLGDAFMRQIARNLTDPFDGFLSGKRHVLMDRDTNFSAAFRMPLEDDILQREDVAACRSRIPCPLSYGAQSSVAGESHHRAG